MRPILHARYESVLHGIEVDVINVTFEIPFVTDRMFPETPLPESLLALR